MPKDEAERSNMPESEQAALKAAFYQTIDRLHKEDLPKTVAEQTSLEEEMTERIHALVKLAEPYGCQVMLYNHNGWFGLIDNQIAIIEYMEKYSTARLIGAPPGYIGYDEGGQLTEAVRRKPYSVVLFDEVEKAHPDVFNVLLQVLDDGRLTDSQGRTVDFKNTVIIMTSNIGSRHLLEGVKGDEIPESTREAVMADLRQGFRPEFLNRIDETVLFKPLTLEEIGSIVDLLLVDLNKRLAERRVTVKLDSKANEWVAERGYDPVFGARPLKRFLQRNLETRLARALLSGDVAEGSEVEFRIRDDKLVMQ